MTFSGFDPGSDMGFNSVDPAPPVRLRRMWRARTVMIVGAVGAVVLGCTATGVVLGSQSVTLSNQAASSSSATATGQGNSATLIPRGGASSSNSNGASNDINNGTPGGFSRATDATDATAASAAQSLGVVLINTVLKYQRAAAAGTGIVLTSTGEILTNNHVINGATKITVTVASTGKTYTAHVVGTDAKSDIAVLSLTGASGLTTATINRTTDLAVADAVTAVGNGGGTGSLSAAAGTITALGQTITASGESSSDSETLNGLIETNANVVPGDSGGPLYNAAGAVIAIDTAASSGSSAVAGYAIPITTALAVAKKIESGKRSADITIGYPAFLGVEVAAAATGSTTATGAGVAGVLADTPAATAGIVAGDTVTSVNGTAITSPSQLTTVLKSFSPKDSVTIGWTDVTGKAHSASVALLAGAAN